jgi:hypothetical protein
MVDVSSRPGLVYKSCSQMLSVTTLSWIPSVPIISARFWIRKGFWVTPDSNYEITNKDFVEIAVWL